jgi:site-specific recombinase XerD
MLSTTKKQSQSYLVSVHLIDAYTDFILSRQAINCTPATLEFYKHTAGVFISWIEKQSIIRPEEITARFVREYLSELVSSGKKDTTLHAHARAIRTLVRFWHSEGYMPQLVKFEMPKLFKKRLPVLAADELQRVIKACNVRDKALVLFMADSGLRRSETINLTWADVNMSNGLIRVKQGKGKKDRASVIGATTRWALLKYKRTIEHEDNLPVFQSRIGGKFTGTGLWLIYRRLSKKTGIHVTPCVERS